MEGDTAGQPGFPVTSGPFEGWRTYRDVDPFEDALGPFFFRKEADGRVLCATVVEKKHLNGHGIMHGGAMMTFADYALFMVAIDHMGEFGGVTVQLDSTFVAPGQLGETVYADGEVVRASGSLIFVRGRIFRGEQTLLSWNGIIKKLKRKL